MSKLLTRYQAWVGQITSMSGPSSSLQSHDANLMLGALGLGGESGEVIDIIKKVLCHGKDEASVREDLLLELGDVLWYWTKLVDELGYTMKEVLTANVDKLNNRYPGRAVF